MIRICLRKPWWQPKNDRGNSSKKISISSIAIHEIPLRSVLQLSRKLAHVIEASVLPIIGSPVLHQSVIQFPTTAVTVCLNASQSPHEINVSFPIYERAGD